MKDISLDLYYWNQFLGIDNGIKKNFFSKKSLHSIILIILFIFSTVIRKKYAIYPGNYELTGTPVVLYHIAGLTFFILNIILVISFGKLILKCLKYYSQDIDNFLLISIIVGFSALNLLFTIIGIVGFLKIQFVLPISLALLILFPYLTNFQHKVPEVSLNNLMIAFAVIIFAYLIIIRGITLGEVAPDVYEHYLHYYDDVVSSGQNLFSKDLWLHNFDLRGLGLFFYSGIVGDILEIQYISLIAFLIIILIVISILFTLTNKHLPALAGAILISGLWLHLGDESGSLFKHHTYVTCQLASLIYLIFNKLIKNNESRIDYIACFISFSVCIVTIQIFPLIVVGLIPSFFYFLYKKELDYSIYIENYFLGWSWRHNYNFDKLL